MREEELSDVAPKRMPRWVIGLALFFLVGGGACLVYRLSLASSVGERLAAIHAQGYPVTLEELDAWYPTPPEGQNAADVYGRAFTALVMRSADQDSSLPILGESELPENDRPLSKEMQEAIAGCLDRDAEAFRLLHEAAALGECRYPVDMTAGFAMLVPHLGRIRRAANLLRLEAAYAAEKGNSDRATRAVTSAVSLARSLKGEPLLISQLVRIACVRAAQLSLERVVNRTALTEAQLTDLQAVFGSAEDVDAMVRALAGERCCAIAIYRDPNTMMAGGGPGVAAMKALLITGLIDADLGHYLDIMADTMAVHQGSFADQRAFKPTVNARVRALPKYCIFSRMLLPALGRAAEMSLRHIGYVRCVRTALAVERFRLANGRPPSALAGLVPKFLAEVPVDPFDDKPLKYKLRDGGYVVYSVGPDGRDDGGETQWGRDRKTRRKVRDLTFTVTAGK